MSQKSIREYDAKTMRSRYIGQDYFGILIQENNSKSQNNVYTPLHDLYQDLEYVVKPDQLFGKRGKHGLLGVKLDPTQTKERIQKRMQTPVEISGKKGILHTFLVEPFVPHDREYYISIQTDKDTDIIHFSDDGGVEIEEVRDTVQTIHIPVGDEISNIHIQTLVKKTSVETLSQEEKKILFSYISTFLSFFRSHGFVYLEANPFVLHQVETEQRFQITCLDMVAKIDYCEAWKQKKNRKDIQRVKPFGSVTSNFELMVEEMDKSTGASLKFSTLNPNGRIALVLGGGGASVVVMDKLADMGLMDDIMNYGELSGNPEYRHNKRYIQGMLDMLIVSKSTGKKRLCVIGGISNFTKIDIMCQAFVDALTPKIDALIEAGIHILIRRGGVNDTVGLALVASFCKKHHIPCEVYDADVYITDSMGSL